MFKVFIGSGKDPAWSKNVNNLEYLGHKRNNGKEKAKSKKCMIHGFALE